MRVGVLGGTFNPVHNGHLRAAEEVRELLGLDRVIFIPAGNPPLKSSGLAAASHRYEMVRLAISGNPFFEISPIEIEKAEPSFTVDTLRALGRLRAGDDLFFIIGLDAFADLHKWKNPSALFELASMVIITRPGAGIDALTGSPFIADATAPDEGKAIMVRGVRQEWLPIWLAGVTPLDISASRVRRMIAEGRSVRYLLPGAVESYIMSCGLYARQP